MNPNYTAMAEGGKPAVPAIFATVHFHIVTSPELPVQQADRVCISPFTSTLFADTSSSTKSSSKMAAPCTLPQRPERPRT